jgi:hypothetical protein
VSLRRLLTIIAAVLTATLASPALLRAQQADVIRGRVIGPDSLPIENATVTVTSIQGGVNRSARTDKSGRFTVTFPNGEGDYMVAFAALGFAAKRFEVKRTADEEILVADAKLSRAAVALDAMKVTAPREKVGRNEPPVDVSGTERPVNPAALPAADLGDLAAMAATLPGVQLVPGENGDPNGFSVLGLGADQNNMTLNGMSFGGSNLPRDAAISSSLVTSPYDVSRGGFSGAQFGLRTRGGSNFITRGMSLNLDAPQMQWTDRAARALGQQYSNLSLGGLVSGPIRLDKAFYNVSYQLERRANDFQSLLNTDPLGLQTAGVAADSVRRFLGILNQDRIPATIGGRLPQQRTSDRGALFGSIDIAPPSSATGQAFNVTFNGSWNRQTPVGSVTTAVPSNSGDRTGWNGGIQGRHNSYFGFGILSETSVGVNESRSYGTPYLAMPAGRVLVNSTFADGTNGLQNLAFGGSQTLNTNQTTTSAQLMNQMSWFSANNKHRIKLTGELRRDAFASDQTTNLLGTFSFNSLADLEANRPSQFTRQLSPRRTAASQVVGAVSIGDAWKPTTDVQIQYGARLDGNRFMSDPVTNPELERLFGVRNDKVPNRLYVSPRLGFSWTYGSAAQIAGFEGAARVPRAVVRGGVGVFQNLPGTTLIASALDNTGLPGGLQQLNCVGAATPVPDWGAYAANPGAVPDRCADGSTGTVFANSAPNVNLFARDFSAPRSLRSNLQWNGPILHNRFSTTLDATYSANLNQASPVDINFKPATQFNLGSEGGRPVFVQPTSIVPTTGAIALADARVSPFFSRVTETRSDLRSESRQLSVRLAPVSFNTTFSWSLSYVYTNVRDRVRGFGSTAGNPLDLEWARSAFDTRHQVVYNLGYNLFDVVRVSWYGSIRSGNPFTPMISGDVNGDGYSNDRAFIFKPGQTADPALDSGMQSLLDHGSRAARSCLTKQLGNLAGRNSCQGPWTSTANMSFSFNPVKVRMPQRATLSFNLSNPLGAADMLFHGQSKLHGWGQTAIPDQALFYVRGFDPAAKRYRYEVNQRFGATIPSLSAFRTPVTLTAMLRFDVGPTRERQSLTMQLDRGRKTQGAKLPEQFLKMMYGAGSIPNPMGQILRQQDSLHLTAPQADSIAALNRWYSIRIDSIWSPVAKYLGDLPNDYDQDAAYDQYLTARRASVDLLSRLAPKVKGLLTAEQFRKLPPLVASYLEPRYLATIRSGTASFTSSPMFPTGGGPGGFGGVEIMAAGAAGGAATVIMRHP